MITYSGVAGEGSSLAVVGIALALVDTFGHGGSFGEWIGLRDGLSLLLDESGWQV